MGKVKRKKDEKARRPSGGVTKKAQRKERKQKFLQRLKEAQDHLALGATNDDVLASVRQIGDALPERKTRAAAPKRSKPLTNKSRQKLFTSEVAQFANVLQHPSFNEDPLSAIRAHLENTIDTAPLAEDTGDASDEDTSGPIRSRLAKAKKAKKKKKRRGEGSEIDGVKVPIGKQKAIKRARERKLKERAERSQPVSAREARRRASGAKQLKKAKGIARAPKTLGLVKKKKKKPGKTVKF